MLPSGRNGITPPLVLRYNSYSKAIDSLYGFGWELPIAYIERSGKYGLEKLYQTTTIGTIGFTLNLFGQSYELVALDNTGTSFGTKIESEPIKITFHTSGSWTVIDSKGTQYRFGVNTQSREDDPTNTTRVYKWMIEEVQDTNGNMIRFFYFKDSGQIYPKTILYTGTASENGIFKINF